MMLKSCQRGALLIAAIVLVVVIAVLVTAMSFLSVSNVGSSGSNMSSAQAFFITQSGLERALFQFSKLGTACSALTNTNLAVGQGSFSTTGTLYPTSATSSTLQTSISTTTQLGVIRVTVTAGAFANYAPQGRIRIENEEIDYSSASSSAAVCGTAPCFVAWRRGANGTTAATHTTIGTAVFQDDQCRIRSTGTVGSTQRILEATIK